MSAMVYNTQTFSLHIWFYSFLNHFRVFSYVQSFCVPPSLITDFDIRRVPKYKA